MPINPDAVGASSEPTTISWTPRDCVIYALGVGAGTDELQFTTHDTKGAPQQVLPTFAVVAGINGARERGAAAGGMTSLMGELGEVNFALLVHGEQAIELTGPIPPEGSAVVTSRIAAIYDKGKGAVVVLESRATDPDTDKARWTATSSMFLRGEGGWGGDRGPSGPRNEPPDRAPDHVVTYETLAHQALWYRLSGDLNPLHSDPDFADMAGFDRPILHGLCTYGFTGRALLHELCDSDPARFRRIEGRFSKPVFPGETLSVLMWEGVGDGEVLFRASTDSGVVIDQGLCLVS